MSSTPAQKEDYDILPATIEDIPSMVKVFYLAFESDEVMGEMERNVDPVLREERMRSWNHAQMENSHLTGAHYYKAVHRPTGELVALGKWDFPVKLTDAQKEEKKALHGGIRASEPLPGSNVSLSKDFLGQLAAKREINRDPERDYFMHLLATHPAHHRKGLGSRLLAEGLNLADRDGARCYIEASRPGIMLYKRHGWKEVDSVTVDMAKHGLPEFGIYTEPCLMREPQKPGNEDREAVEATKGE